MPQRWSPSRESAQEYFSRASIRSSWRENVFVVGNTRLPCAGVESMLSLLASKSVKWLRERTNALAFARANRSSLSICKSRRSRPRLLRALGPLTKLGSILPTGQHLEFYLDEDDERKNSLRQTATRVGVHAQVRAAIALHAYQSEGENTRLKTLNKKFPAQTQFRFRQSTPGITREICILCDGK